jgi:glycosyltransferase involved in cell wall biosynthesis
MAKALQEHVGEVIFLGPDDSLPTRAIVGSGRVLNRASYAIFRRHISFDHHRILSKRLGHTLDRLVAESACDVLFAPTASVEIAYLSTNVPIIYYTDMNWADMVDYYPGCSSLFAFSRREGDRIDAAAIRKASASIFPSVWAARSAIKHYKADPRKVHCISFGANLEQEDIPLRDAALKHSLDHGIALLWVGVDWERKGGAVAYDCLTELLNRGLDARMAVCGCVPPKRFRHPKIEVVPFLSKRDPRQRRKLSQLFLDSNFFLFPTRADATPIVLTEASAHGLPSLARDTGGVGGAVTDGKNGYLLAPDATGKQYAEKILEIVRDDSLYNYLVKASRSAYEERLNWDAWACAIKPIFEQLARRSPVETLSSQGTEFDCS